MTLKKTFKMCARISFFEKSLRNVAEMVPGRLPKVVQKWSKNQWEINFIENPGFYLPDLPFFLPVGVRGYPPRCKNTEI